MTFDRHPVPPGLAGLVEFGWSVRWDLPAGRRHDQDVLPFPTVNIGVGDAPPEGPDSGPGPYPVRAYVTGPASEVTTRVLSGRGRNVALRSTIGGFGAFVDDVRTLTDRVVDLAEVVPHDLDPESLHDAGAAEVVEALSAVLLRALGEVPEHRMTAARDVAAWAAAAEHDRGLRSVDQWARAAGVSARTMQRMVARAAGVSPARVLRRFRLVEAIEMVRAGDEVSWAQVAADLGYADQAHLTRDFTATIGVPPAKYAALQRS